MREKSVIIHICVYRVNEETETESEPVLLYINTLVVISDDKP